MLLLELPRQVPAVPRPNESSQPKGLQGPREPPGARIRGPGGTRGSESGAPGAPRVPGTGAPNPGPLGPRIGRNCMCESHSDFEALRFGCRPAGRKSNINRRPKFTTPPSNIPKKHAHIRPFWKIFDTNVMKSSTFWRFRGQKGVFPGSRPIF